MKAHSGWIVLVVLACGTSPPAREPSLEHARRPARIAAYAHDVHGGFDADRALRTVAFVDGFFRVRGNAGYQASLGYVRRELEDGGVTVRTLELGPARPAWTPRAATLALDDGAVVQFASERERDRACLLVGSDALAETELELVRAGERDVRGRVVLAEGDPGRAFRLFVEGSGAAGIVVHNLEAYHRDPDAAQFGYLPPHERPAFGFSVSRNVWDRLWTATEAGPARVRVAIDVAISTSAATAIEARIEGSDPEAGAIVFVAHVDEPGANDNASGVAASAELARTLRRLVDGGAPLRRTLVFLWGQEIEVSERWLAEPPSPVAAGLVMDMVGADPAIVGAPFLIERMPDPGAVWLRAPDVHSEWGASEVDERELRGHFLDDLTIAAASSVARFDPFEWRDHPFEGGSDHVPFLREGLPAILGWHFTDSAYHTTLDRLERVSGAQMRRVAAVLGAVALVMASGDREDALETLSIVQAAARARLFALADASRALIEAGGSDEATEARVRAAWITFYDQALASIAAHTPSVRGEVDRARAVLDEAR